jgi:hypothetical protein
MASRRDHPGADTSGSSPSRGSAQPTQQRPARPHAVHSGLCRQPGQDRFRAEVTPDAVHRAHVWAESSPPARARMTPTHLFTAPQPAHHPPRRAASNSAQDTSHAAPDPDQRSPPPLKSAQPVAAEDPSKSAPRLHPPAPAARSSRRHAPLAAPLGKQAQTRDGLHPLPSIASRQHRRRRPTTPPSVGSPSVGFSPR